MYVYGTYICVCVCACVRVCVTFVSHLYMSLMYVTLQFALGPEKEVFQYGGRHERKDQSLL